MQKSIRNIFMCLVVLMTMSSCYTYTYTVGDGPQTNVTVTQKNHYFVYGLAPGTQSIPSEMAGDAENYRVTIQHTFVDGLINGLTFGIYTPTTTTVTK